MSDPTNATAPMSPPDPRPDALCGDPCPVGGRLTCERPTGHRGGHESAIPQGGTWGWPNVVDPNPRTTGITEYPGERHYRKVLRVGDTTVDTAAGEVPVYGFEPVEDGECGRPILTEMLADPAPSGLTAAQKIRLRLVEALEFTALSPDEFVAKMLAMTRPLAAWVEHGVTDDLEDACTERCPNAEAHIGWPAACPDPALHEDSGIEDFYRQITNLGELVAAEQDRVAELERQRDAVLALASRMDISGQHTGPFWADEVRRAIGAEHEDDDPMPEPCQPIGCDNGFHLPGCPYAAVDNGEFSS